MAPIINHAQVAYDAIERLERARDLDELITTFRLCLEQFGITIVLITGLPDPPADPTPYFLLNGWPPGWQDHYIAEDFYRDDPVAQFGRLRIDPFTWSSAPIDTRRHPRARQVMAEAASVGMCEGFVIPILTCQSEHACVSVAGEKPRLDAETQRTIQFIGTYAHARAMRLSAGSGVVPRQWLLSEREREVLRWTAEGKTTWETSRILGISARTVTYHIATASQRLKAGSRTHAVARALALGEIALN